MPASTTAVERKAMSQTIRLVILVAIFVGIVAWAFARRRQGQFERDARIPFRDDGGRSPP